MDDTSPAPPDFGSACRGALLDAASGSAAVAALYGLFKARGRKYSLAYFGKRAGISSTGYLSDVVNGKRSLHRKYADAVGAAFDLGPDEAAYLRAMILREQPASAAEVLALDAELATRRKILAIQRLPLTEKIGELFFAIEVFCGFGLFANHPTRDQLVDYFGRARFPEVDRALAALVELRMIARDGPGYRLLTNHVSLSGAGTEVSFADFIKASLSDASRKVERLAAKRDSAHFESGIVSVRRQDFERQLPELRSRIAHLISGMEHPEADGLVRVNVQIYPVD